MELELLILVLTVLATSVMAASAVTQAVRFEFDFFGAIFLALVTAVGGGTIRDLLIGISPVFWVADLTYLAVAVPIGALTYFLVRRMEIGTGYRAKLLLYLDALGLALFTLVGIEVALSHHVLPIMAIILGCITGIGGGMIRDILCGIPPIVLKSDIYASLSLLGGVIYTFTEPFAPDQTRLIVAFLFIALARIWIVARQEL